MFSLLCGGAAKNNRPLKLCLKQKFILGSKNETKIIKYRIPIGVNHCLGFNTRLIWFFTIAKINDLNEYEAFLSKYVLPNSLQSKRTSDLIFYNGKFCSSITHFTSFYFLSTGKQKLYLNLFEQLFRAASAFPAGLVSRQKLSVKSAKQMRCLDNGWKFFSKSLQIILVRICGLILCSWCCYLNS